MSVYKLGIYTAYTSFRWNRIDKSMHLHNHGQVLSLNAEAENRQGLEVGTIMVKRFPPARRQRLNDHLRLS